MKSKLLRKIRKRYEWRFELFDIILIDHEKKQIERYKFNFQVISRILRDMKKPELAVKYINNVSRLREQKEYKEYLKNNQL